MPWIDGQPALGGTSGVNIVSTGGSGGSTPRPTTTKKKKKGKVTQAVDYSDPYGLVTAMKTSTTHAIWDAALGHFKSAVK